MEQFYICADVYRDEIRRLCLSYISAVDSMIPAENNLSGDIDLPINRVLLCQLKNIAKKLWTDCDIISKINKRIYFLELHGVKAEFEEDNIYELSEKAEFVYKCYELCMKAFAYSKEPINAVMISDELLSKLENHDISERNTLIGALRAPRQLGICLKRKFYHIPASYIEEYAIPEYVAIYQSERIFGKELAGIKYYGKVKKCTPMRRSKIREIPKKSNELYYKFKIKEWKRLENPVAAKEIGFIRLFTNIFLLENAIEVPELTATDKYGFSLYRLLKLAQNEIENRDAVFSGFKIDGCEVVFTFDAIYLCKEQSILKKYLRSLYSSAPSVVFENIKKELEKDFQNK